jgi:hypothetical protein
LRGTGGKLVISFGGASPRGELSDIYLDPNPIAILIDMTLVIFSMTLVNIQIPEIRLFLNKCAVV